MQNARFRNQISWLMFIFGILVIWVHSYNVELFAGTTMGAAWDRVVQMETFWSVGIGQIAVPGFFMLSSYLFFRNFTREKLPVKWKSRFFSVAVPYAAWNILYYMGYVIATRLPMVQQVVGKEPIPFNIEEVCNALLHYSYAPIFWYLFQLILLLLLAPIVFVLVKNRWIGIAYLGMLIAAIYFHMDTGHPNTDALLYFSFAAYAAVHWRGFLEQKGTNDRIMAGVGVLIVAVYSYGIMKEPGANVLWTIVYRLLVPVSLFLMTSAFEMPQAKPWMKLSMFQYGIHFIFVRFMNKGTAMVLLKLAPEAWRMPAAVLVYFALPALIVAVSYLAARILSHFLPPVWQILSGGRSLEA